MFDHNIYLGFSSVSGLWSDSKTTWLQLIVKVGVWKPRTYVPGFQWANNFIATSAHLSILKH